MNSDLELVPLDCPSCGAGIGADGDDVVYYCTACRNGYRFDGEARRLSPVEVSFVALPQVAADLYKPFWLLATQVTLHERNAKGGAFGGLMGFFFGGNDTQTGRSEGVFAVPAFHASLASVVELTRRYTEAFPELGERLGERLVGGCYDVEDAEKLAHCALIASEIDKPDTLTHLRYDLEIQQARLLGVPFVRRDGKLVDAIFGIGG